MPFSSFFKFQQSLFFFFFMFCMLFVLYCKFITYASLLDSTSTKYYNTNVYFNTFQASISPHLEQFLSCNLQGFFLLPSSLLLVSWLMSTSLLPLWNPICKQNHSHFLVFFVWFFTIPYMKYIRMLSLEWVMWFYLRLYITFKTFLFISFSCISMFACWIPLLPEKICSFFLW